MTKIPMADILGQIEVIDVSWDDIIPDWQGLCNIYSLGDGMKQITIEQVVLRLMGHPGGQGHIPSIIFKPEKTSSIQYYYVPVRPLRPLMIQHAVIYCTVPEIA